MATPRVAKAVKAEIPCVDDPVSKLEDIGEKTQKKLLDIQAAADSCGVHDLVFPDRSIITGMGPMPEPAKNCGVSDMHAAVTLPLLPPTLHLVYQHMLRCLNKLWPWCHVSTLQKGQPLLSFC